MRGRPLPLRPRSLAGCLTSLAVLAGFAPPALAAPVDFGNAPPTSALAFPGETPIEVERWIGDETLLLSLTHGQGGSPHEVLLQGWQPRPPTWIQGGALANPVEHPGLEDSVEKAERDLQTLQWAIEQQQREADARPRGRDGEQVGGPQEHWLRKLLPQHWIPLLKANREWVVAGGTALLLLAWGGSMFARRPGPTAVAAHPNPPPAKKRRHRRRRSGLLVQ